MSALRDLAASLGAGQVAQLHTNTQANFSNATASGSPANPLSQLSRFQYDWTPWRTYGREERDGHWTGFSINHSAGYTAGTTAVVIDGGHAADLEIAPGMLINFDSVPGQYTVTSGFIGTSGTVTFTPALAFDALHPGPLVDNARVLITKSGRRFFVWCHAHSAGSYSWPVWSCYEEATHKWTALDSMRTANPSGPNNDDVLTEILFGYFHQNNGNTINPGAQIFWRQYNANNPMTLNRVDISPWNLRDIGRCPHRTLQGSWVFTTGSATVHTVGNTGGAALTELGVGDSIWSDGDTLIGDSDMSRWVMTIKTVDSDNSVTLYNTWGSGGAGGGGDRTGTAKACTNYDMQTHWSWEPGVATGGGSVRPTGEYWPEKDMLLVGHFTYQAAVVYGKRTTYGESGAWQLIAQWPANFDNFQNGGDVNELHYNTKRRCMLAGAGVNTVPPTSGKQDGFNGMDLYEIRLNDLNDPIEGSYSVVKLDHMPDEGYAGTPSGGFIFHCPICGKYLFLNMDWAQDGAGYPSTPSTHPFIFGQLDPSLALGSQFTHLTNPFPAGMICVSAGDYKVADGGMVAALPDLGVIGFVTTAGTWLYKHCDNNRALNGLTTVEKANFPGVWSSTNWGSGFTVRPNWRTIEENDPPFAAAIAAGGYVNYSGPLGFNVHFENWGAGTPNSRPGGTDGVCIPSVVTDVTYKGQAGALRFKRPVQIGDSPGYAILHPIDDAAYNRKIINPTSYGLSSMIHVQYPLRLNTAQFGPYETCSAWQVTCSVDVPGNTITLPANTTHSYDNTWIGKGLYIHIDGRPNWKEGFYTIAAVPNTQPKLPATESSGAVNLVGGSGYTDANNVPTTGGSGSGLLVNIQTGSGGYIAHLTWNSGSGYLAGDHIVINQGGNTSASFDLAATRLTLDRSPLNAVSTASGGTASVQSYNSQNMSGSSKIDIFYGNAPWGQSSSGDNETTTIWHKTDFNSNPNSISTNYLNMYAIQGQLGLGTNAYSGPQVPDAWSLLDKIIQYKPLGVVGPAVGRRGYARGDWTSGGAGSTVIHSNSLQAAIIENQGAVNAAFFFITGYGPTSPTSGSSKWVSGIYTVVNLDTGNGNVTLDRSPTPSGAGTEGVIFILDSMGVSLNRNTAVLKVNGVENTYADYLKLSSRPGGGGTTADRYGIGVIDLIPYQNGADPNYINPAGPGYAYYGDVIMSGQPIPYDTVGTLVFGIDTTSPLPSGTVGTAYSKIMLASGGVTPYTWNLTSGTLPAGLTLSTAGVITGTPTTAGTSTPTIHVVDSAGTPANASGVFSITITAPGVLTITTSSPLPSGTVGTAYSTSLTATGGTTPYTWSLSSGTLPAGLTLATSGLISGTPTAASTVSITAQVTDSVSGTTTQALSITINPSGTPAARPVLPFTARSF